jgi:hypothetical protein
MLHRHPLDHHVAVPNLDPSRHHHHIIIIIENMQINL